MLLGFLALFTAAAALHMSFTRDVQAPTGSELAGSELAGRELARPEALPLPDPGSLAGQDAGAAGSDTSYIPDAALGQEPAVPPLAPEEVADPLLPRPDAIPLEPDAADPGQALLPEGDLASLPLPVPPPADEAGQASDPEQGQEAGPTGSPARAKSPAPMESPQPRTLAKVVRTGEVFPRLVAGYANADEIQAMFRAAGKVHALTQLHAGRPYTLHLAADGTLEAFVYEIDRSYELRVERRKEGGFTASRTPIAYETRTQVVHGAIRHSLFKSVTDLGEAPGLASLLVEMFDSEINFIKDVRLGDRFSILVEKRYRDGEFRGYGQVLAARFATQGKTFEGFRFAVEKTGDYYNAKGESLRKTLLMAPLAVTRITSGYSLSRRHPVYFDKRPHEGVDYGAPLGTPVRAVGSGVIAKAGWGNGFGNMVVLTHGVGLESMYSHLSKFAPGVKAGTRVKQGQTIGYVGASGVATGPHLDFRLKQNGKYVDPTKVVNPRAASVPPRKMKAFAARMNELRAALGGREVVPGPPATADKEPTSPAKNPAPKRAAYRQS